MGSNIIVLYGGHKSLLCFSLSPLPSGSIWRRSRSLCLALAKKAKPVLDLAQIFLGLPPSLTEKNFRRKKAIK